ncbi:hypothetical protein CFE53_04650 [Methanofervidicoccus sp. A16]|uniref:NosD domain-containing protein n=1 Tax=Methanofervidicoccus sp. A16 TaxID=2607662 RepID=UPI00118B1AF7|nr:right-handed parallel beta-helix repeat-containing protein [Methanofervidicoccus sp. A16]AXI25458.1 hypothetical protein CFE53_04650 [Methanofervidicoccus sp. A16]
MKRVYTTLFLLTLFLGIVSVYGDTIYVPDNYSTIQRAIDAAKDGDVIVVRDGIYYENLVINKSIILKSENGPENCIIDGNNSGNVIVINVDGVTIDGFTVRGAGGWFNAGIRVISGGAGGWFNAGIRVISGGAGGWFNAGIRVISGGAGGWFNAGIRVISDNNIIRNNSISDNWIGIYLSSSNNNTISGNDISDNGCGIYLSSSNNNTISGNDISDNNWGGIHLDSSSNNNIKNNTFINDGIFIVGGSLKHWDHTIKNNTVNDKPLYYLKNQRGGEVPEDAGQVILVNCSEMIVENLSISNTDVGIVLGFSSQIVIRNNNISNNWRGIYLSSSNNNTISGNDISDNNWGGIRLYSSSNNTISGNDILDNNWGGIHLDSSNNNTISGNDISDNEDDGIYLSSSNNNTISGNDISDNGCGIRLYSSSNNTISGNDISDNNWGGIRLYSSSNNTISGNDISDNNWGGIRLYSSSNNNIKNNTFINDGIFIVGGSLKHWDHTIKNNTVNDKPLYYLKNQRGGEVPEDTGQVILVNCSEMIVENLSISNTDVGIVLGFSSQIVIRNNNISNNWRGIYLSSSNNNTISGNDISDNEDDGIYLSSSNNNTISGNDISDNGCGIYLSSSNNNTISGNDISDNNWGGIHLDSSNNNTISGNDISDNGCGIRLYSSSNNTISGNDISDNNWGGIRLYSSSNNNIKNNTFINDGIFIVGGSLKHWDHTIKNNTVNDKPLYYLKNQRGGEVPEDTGQVILVNCSEMIVENLSISNTDVGIVLGFSSQIVIRNNNISNNWRGIYLSSSNNNTISGNDISDNEDDGIYLSSSNNNTISGNDISDNGCGIYLSSSNNNTISGNDISDNNWGGIHLDSSNNNTISGNDISDNWRGIYLSSSSNNNTISGNDISDNGCGIRLYYLNNNIINNTIYLNNFINNSNNVGIFVSIDISTPLPTDIWHSPEKITYTYNGTQYTNYLGNYWDDYTGNDTDGDGIGDTPYQISSYDIDNYPLMQPWQNYIIPDINITPISIDFGNTLVNETKTVIITITNRGNADLIITNISTEYRAPPAEIGLKNIPKLPLILKPKESYNLTAFFSPSKEGNYSSNITIESNDPDKPTITIPLIGRAVNVPNLKIEYININTPIYNGIKTEINVSIINDGTKDINTSFLVDITIKNSSQEVVYNITRNISKLNKSKSEIITFNWTPEKPGTYNVTVTVDPDNKINELNKTDNNKTLTIEVKPISVSIRLYKISGNNNNITAAIEISNIPDYRPLKKYNISIKLQNLSVINITSIGNHSNVTSDNTLIITGNVTNKSGEFIIVNITFNITNSSYSAILEKAELLDTNNIPFYEVILKNEIIGTVENIKINVSGCNVTTKSLIEVGDINLTELQIINNTDPSQLNDTLIIPIVNESANITINDSIIGNITRILEVAENITKEKIKNESDVKEVVEKIAGNITPVLSQNFNISNITNRTEIDNSTNTVRAIISFRAENTSNKGFVIVRIPIGNLTVKNVTVIENDTVTPLPQWNESISSDIGWYRIPVKGVLEITLIKDPMVNITLSANLSTEEDLQTPGGSSTSNRRPRGPDEPRESTEGSEGRTTSSTIIETDIKSEEIRNFIYKTKLIVGSEIDINLSAKYLKTDIDLIDTPFEIKEDCILVGGPVANPVVKKYLNYFPVRVTNEYPGKHKGVIEVIKIDGHTVVLLAGSDRWGTKAAVEYFKTLEDLPDEPIFVEWRNGEAVRIERP